MKNKLLILCYDDGHVHVGRFATQQALKEFLVSEMNEYGGFDEFSKFDEAGEIDLDSQVKFVSANGKLDCAIVDVPKIGEVTNTLY